MRKREQLLWDAMKRNLPAALWMQRVENLVGDGMPDVYIGRTGCWVELKAPSRIPTRPTTPLLGKEGLRQSQKNWFIKHRTMAAPESYILIRALDGEIFLIAGMHADGVNEMTVEVLRHESMADSWPAVADVLWGGLNE